MKGARLRQACGDGASRARRYTVLLSVFSAFVAAVVGMLAFVGASGAQTGDASFLLREGTPPPGANDPGCRPSAAHPYPVVLVHGTFETMAQNWAVLSPSLRAQGYCVYALNYGGKNDADPVQNGLGPIQASARDLDGFVDDVLEYTGAQKVQVVGHSQGGMMPRYWVKYLGGKRLVEDLVGIAPSNYGTELNQADSRGTTGISNPCVACEQQRAGSRFLRRLNAGDDTPGRGSFTQIATDDDEIIIPYTNCFLRGERRTENITLQDYNAGLLVTHQNIYNDPFAQKLVFDALGNPGPADPERAFAR